MQQTSHSFTIRVPRDIYLELLECSSTDGVPMNVKVNQLLRLGLDKQVDLTETLLRMVTHFSTMPSPANGN